MNSPEEINPLELTPEEIYLFKEGSYTRMYEKFGVHSCLVEGKEALFFRVWAPNAASVSVVGDFNHYDGSKNPLKLRKDGSGIWEGVVKDSAFGQTYKYQLTSKNDPSTPFQKIDSWFCRVLKELAAHCCVAGY
jgi:1,4-alpha-glucan branching enzyme